MSLAAHFRLRRGALELDIALEVHGRETLALVGPNGAGKSSCLHALAGLLAIDSGSITYAGELLDAGPAGRFVPSGARDVGFVFQDQLLFPHLDALDNVAFGLSARGMARQAARAAARSWLQRVGLESRAHARPAQLSGGESQRVALARALCAAPRLLLLDEPLSAVDASARIALRRELREHLEAFDGVRIVVAHDALDAFALADRIAVLEGGRIVQTGSAAAICGQPRSPYVADLVGLNLVRGVARDGVLTTEAGGRLIVASRHAGPAFATFHPRAVALFPAEPEGSPRNVWRAPVTAIEPAIDRLRVQVGGALPLVAEVTQAARAELELEPGREVWVALKATEIEVYSA